MIKLTVGNSETIIEGLDLDQHRKLRQVLSYKTQPYRDYYSGAYKSKLVPLIDKKGRFPTGLLPYAQKWLITQNLNSCVVDPRLRPKTQWRANMCVLGGIKPYDVQIDAAAAAKRHERGIIVAPTGVGKSIIIALIIDQLKVNTLVVVPSLELKTQLTRSLQSFFGQDMAGPLSQAKAIAVENVDALDPDKPLVGYDSVIVDEFHHAAAKTYRDLNKNAWVNVYYRFGLTATPFRSQDNEKLLLESFLSQVIYRVEYTKAVEHGFIVPMEAYYLNLPKTKIKGNPKSWPAMYKELVVENAIRNKIIAELISNLNSSGKSTLCLVKEISHGENLTKLTGVDFVKGDNVDNRIKLLEFTLREKTVLIGTTGIIGEGVDTKPCEYVIIAGLGKSKNALMQQFGRAFRTYAGKESAKIILFNDYSHKWTKEHFKEQCKILFEEYGIIPVQLTIK